jgi:hypothetical protein
VSEAGNQEAAEKLFAAFERWDLATVESLIAEEAVEGRPQSGERFVGRTNIMGMLGSLPSEPQISWRTVRGGPQLWAAEGIVEYGEGPVHLIGIVEVQDGRIVKADYYFAYPFEPADWRVPFAEPPAS